MRILSFKRQSRLSWLRCSPPCYSLLIARSVLLSPATPPQPADFSLSLLSFLSLLSSCHRLFYSTLSSLFDIPSYYALSPRFHSRSIFFLFQPMISQCFSPQYSHFVFDIYSSPLLTPFTDVRRHEGEWSWFPGLLVCLSLFFVLTISRFFT